MENALSCTFAELSTDELFATDGGESPAYYARYVVGALLGVAYDFWIVMNLLG